jgi:hypothetical protein
MAPAVVGESAVRSEQSRDRRDQGDPAAAVGVTDDKRQPSGEKDRDANAKPHPSFVADGPRWGDAISVSLLAEHPVVERP